MYFCSHWSHRDRLFHVVTNESKDQRPWFSSVTTSASPYVLMPLLAQLLNDREGGQISEWNRILYKDVDISTAIDSLDDRLDKQRNEEYQLLER